MKPMSYMDKFNALELWAVIENREENFWEFVGMKPIVSIEDHGVKGYEAKIHDLISKFEWDRDIKLGQGILPGVDPTPKVEFEFLYCDICKLDHLVKKHNNQVDILVDNNIYTNTTVSCIKCSGVE